jgi:hypothetical protein
MATTTTTPLDWKAKLRESLKESEAFDKILSKARRGRSSRSKSQKKKQHVERKPFVDRSNATSSKDDDVTQKIQYDSSSSSSTTLTTSTDVLTSLKTFSSASSGASQHKRPLSNSKTREDDDGAIVPHHQTSSTSSAVPSTNSSMTQNNTTKPISKRLSFKHTNKCSDDAATLTSTAAATTATTTSTDDDDTCTSSSSTSKSKSLKPKRVFGRRLGGGAVRLGGRALGGGGLGRLDVIEEDDENEITSTVFLPEDHSATKPKRSSPSTFDECPDHIRDSPLPLNMMKIDQAEHEETTIVFNTGNSSKTTSSSKQSSSGSSQHRDSVNAAAADDEEVTVALFQPLSERKVRKEHSTTATSALSSSSTTVARNAASTPKLSTTSTTSATSATAAASVTSTNKRETSETPVHRRAHQDRTSRSSSRKTRNRDGSTSSSSKSKHQIHVNGISYSKLSLLGRGGSCKVFKVLAPDQKVLALKRIKLTRTDRKTIAMFENEIALMERLRGRDNIIQLVDHEINISKRLIFMVMEAGDMDLAHTLEKKKIEATGGLEEHFLRVTWRQVCYFFSRPMFSFS